MILNVLSKPTRIYRDGRWTEVDARESGVSIALPKGGIATAYPWSGSQAITLPRYLPGIRNVSVVLGVPNSHLADLMFSMARQISAGELTVEAATRSFLETIEKDPDHWLEAPPGPLSAARWEGWMVVTGWKEGRRGRYTYWPTKFAPLLVVAALCIMRGDVSVRGVLPPEACFEPQPFFDEMVSLMPDPPPDGKLFGECFEWLE
jgi:saccharopine dehydrogenase-like NADP-dependent oxidoreductase